MAVKRSIEKHRRLFATGALFAFVLAWVVPAQACFASMSTGTATHSTCPDCPCPGSCDTTSCDVSITAQCATSMLPAATAPAHSLDKAAPIPAALISFAPQVLVAGFKPASRPGMFVYPPSTSVNIRFCTFLE